jgi:hypothetical protein
VYKLWIKKRGIIFIFNPSLLVLLLKIGTKAVAAVFDHFSFSLCWLQALAAEDTVWPFIEQR